MDVIEVRGLAKAYREVVAIDGLDLTVREGEVFSLLGPNGAGKTTTIEILEGYRRADAGMVRVLGVDPMDGDAKWRSRIGLVLQTTTAFDELTVEEMVGHFGRLYPHSMGVDETIDLVGLQDKRRSRLDKLSGGQRRRVDVALGIVGRPELLFLDEPTTGFDPEARRQFWDLIRTLRKEGTTILLTTHYLDEAEALADRVGVIVRGRLVACGSPADLRGGSGLAVVTYRCTETGEMARVETAEPGAVVAGLYHRLGEVPDLAITRPTLEDAYLALLEAHR